jgi:hypothetical protein
MDDARAHRPKPARKNPYRTMAGLWGAAAGPSAPDAPERDPSDPDEPDEDGSFVDAGVRAAYAVLDAYLRQGRRVARSIGQYSLPLMRSTRQARERQARFLQLTSELTANWFDLLGLATESFLPFLEPGAEPRDADERPAKSEPARAASSIIGVTYDIASARPVRVRLDFEPGKATRDLACHGLRSLEQGRAPIAASFEARDDDVLVTIRVPEQQPPGLYTDVVLDARTGRIVGSLCLELR